jgi:uncharacterized protein (TIGR00296 family)
MDEKMNIEEGEITVRAARQAVEAEVRGQKEADFHLPLSFKAERGVFVTLHTYPNMDLRGCIGYPDPTLPLSKALLLAGEGVCHDPRFPMLKEWELDHIVVEVSVLTPPELIQVEDRSKLPEVVEVGRDGLIVEMSPFRGLLLPQVPVEWKWNAETFLCQTCIKAGLSPNCWKERQARFFKFQAEVFCEESPRGRVVRKELL